MSRVNCQLEDRAFKKVFRKWKKLSGVPDPSSKSMYPFWRLEFFETKITLAKAHCNLPPEENILLLYDMTFMSTTENCCVLGRFGIYSNVRVNDNPVIRGPSEAPLISEEPSAPAARGCLRRTNTINRLTDWIRRTDAEAVPRNKKAFFVPWTDFFSAQVLSREGRKIYLNGQQILEGYTHCKLFFSLLYYLFQHFSSIYPFHFLLYKPQLPPNDLILTIHDLKQIMQESKLSQGNQLKSFEQLSQRQKHFFSKIPCFQHEVIHFVYKYKREYSVITHRGMYSVMTTNEGEKCFVCPTNSDSGDDVDFYSWKEILEDTRFVMKSGESLFFNDKPFTVSNKKMFLLVNAIHVFLGEKYQEKLSSPPKYDDLSLFLSKQTENFTEPTNSTCSIVLLADKRTELTEVEQEGVSIVVEDLSQSELPPSYSPSSVRRSPCTTRKNSQPPLICLNPPPYLSSVSHLVRTPASE